MVKPDRRRPGIQLQTRNCVEIILELREVVRCERIGIDYRDRDRNVLKRSSVLGGDYNLAICSSCFSVLPLP